MTETWKDASICPHCMTEDVVVASGPKNAQVLLIGAYPDERELVTGKPFTGNGGVILKAELGRVGLDIKQFRLVYLQHHVPNKNPACSALGVELAIAELTKYRQIVLLIGSEPVKFFCKKSVDDVNGLQVHSPMITQVSLVMACVSPASVFSKSVGELRFAIKQFNKALEEGMIK